MNKTAGESMETISNKPFDLLSWDSDFFGYKVARILPFRLKGEELKRIKYLLKEDNVALAYWPSDPDDPESQEAAEKNKCFLADRKITYLVDLIDIQNDFMKVKIAGTIEYTRKEPNEELYALSVQSGLYSRYNVDPKIGKENFEKLYRTWIGKSVDGTLAEKVYVSLEEGKISGMVTVGMKNGRGEIGLIAVQEGMRGRNVGLNLVRTAQQWAVRKGCRYAQVVTQGENLAACKLYEKCGYRLESIVHFYHMWL